jgi:heme-degrading monooxygenase HmoA
MRARLTRLTARPDTAQALTHIYSSDVLRAGLALPGVTRMVLLLNEVTQAALSMSLWEDEPGTPAPELQPAFTSALAAHAQPELYDVSAWARAGGGPTRASVVVTRAAPDRLDYAIDVARQVILPNIAQQPGFSGSALFSDTATGALVNATAWRAEADMEAFVRTPAAQLGVAALERHLIEPMLAQVYTILFMY